MTRYQAKRNETDVCNDLEKNGKFFVSPLQDDLNFKELFQHMVSAGAGRPVDGEGIPDGPWTANNLAEAILQVDPARAGIDLRTVQNWFQDNHKGISSNNIHLLARVVGCNDPDATSEWQVVLNLAQSKLVSARRKKRTTQEDLTQRLSPSHSPRDDHAKPNDQQFSLPRVSDALFSTSPLNLPAALWAGWVVLGFLTFIMGVHSVTYSPLEGLDKQVGLFWAPNWTLLVIVLLPMFLVVVTRLLVFWKKDARPKLTSGYGGKGTHDSWLRKVESFSVSHWAILLVCFGIVFALQWSGVHLRALLKGDAGVLMVDWNLVAISRPEIISRQSAVFLSMLAFLFTSVEAFLYLTGLLFLYSLASDFHELGHQQEFQTCETFQCDAREIGTKLMSGIYRSVIIGILMITCIKLQTSYLLSDAQSIVDLLVGDALFALGMSHVETGWLGQRSLANFTSFALLFTTSTIFATCFFQFYRVLGPTRSSNVPWWPMVGVVVLLVINCLLIGQFSGFSILLTVGVLVAIYSLYDPMFGRAQVKYWPVGVNQ